MLDASLSQIGFTDSESRVYMELLKIGAQPVSVIAKRTRFNRSSTYSILKGLAKKGVVSSHIRNGVKFFAASDPNCLVSYLDSKYRDLDYCRAGILSAIPKFRSLCDVFDYKKPIVSYFEGLEGAKHVMYDSLNETDYFYSYLCLDKWLKAGLREFIIDYRRLRIYNRQIPMKGIVADLPEVRQFFEENYKSRKQRELTEIRYIDPDKMDSLFNNEMNIYGDKVAIMHLEKGNEYGVLIEGHDIASMHKTIFEMVWNGMK